MDIIRDIWQELRFGPFCTSRDFLIASPYQLPPVPPAVADWDELLDVYLQLYTRPECVSKGSLGLCPDDVRVTYRKVDGTAVEVTGDFRNALRAGLRSRPPKDAISEYRLALTEWLTQVRRFGPALGIDLKAEEAAVNRMLMAQPDDWLDRLVPPQVLILG